jgi:hypothetical protein
MLTEHFYQDVIDEPKPKPIEKEPTKRQTEQPLDDPTPDPSATTLVSI